MPTARANVPRFFMVIPPVLEVYLRFCIGLLGVELAI
jgi:hypothetical protein